MAVDTGWNNETSRNNEQVSRTEFQIVDRQFGVFILLLFGLECLNTFQNIMLFQNNL